MRARLAVAGQGAALTHSLKQPCSLEPRRLLPDTVVPALKSHPDRRGPAALRMSGCCYRSNGVTDIKKRRIRIRRFRLLTYGFLVCKNQEAISISQQISSKASKINSRKQKSIGVGPFFHNLFANFLKFMNANKMFLRN